MHFVVPNSHYPFVQNRDRVNGVTRRPSHQQPFQEDKEHQSGAPGQHQRNGGSNHQRPKSMSSLEPQEHDVEHSNKHIGMDHQTWLRNRQKQTTLPIIILPEGEEREKKRKIKDQDSQAFSTIQAKLHVEELQPIDTARCCQDLRLSRRPHGHGGERSQHHAMQRGPGLHNAASGHRAACQLHRCQDHFAIHLAMTPKNLQTSSIFKHLQTCVEGQKVEIYSGYKHMI